MPTFWEQQSRRLRFRAFVMRQMITMGLFWTFALVLGAWLQVSGLAILSWALLGLWVYLALPSLALQLATFTDLALYALTGRAYLLRILERVQGHGSFEEFDAALRARGKWQYRYIRARVSLGETSPLAPLSTWALLVLFRLPASAHLHRPTPITEFPVHFRETAVRLASTRMVAAR